MTTRPARGRLGAISVCALSVWLCASSFAQTGQSRSVKDPGPMPKPAEQRPESARRFVRVFDFEDRDNPYPVPPGWLRAQEDPTLVADPSGALDSKGRPVKRLRTVRAGFPPHNEAAYDFKHAASGRASIRVPVKGGSASLRLQPGELPVFADADYAITARVKTRGLQNARAYVTARLLDGSLHPIEGSTVRSAPMWDGNAAEWAVTSVELPAKFSTAAWMQIDLEVLQPRQWRVPGALGVHEVWTEDLDGEAWFDDVLVYLQPLAKLRSLQACNVAIGHAGSSAESAAGAEGDRDARKDLRETEAITVDATAAGQPVIEASVRDLGGDALTAHIRVFDTENVEVARTSFPVDPSGLPQRWVPALPGYGAYMVRLDVLSDSDLRRAGRSETGVTVASSSLPIAWVPAPGVPPGADAGYKEDLRRFGVLASERHVADSDQLATAVKRLGTRFLVMPMFEATTRREGAKEELARRAKAIDELITGGQEITLSFERPPSELVQTAVLDPGDPLAMMGRPSAEWFAYLQPTLDRFGQQIRRYQVGVPGDDRLMWQDELPMALSTLERQLSTLVPGPELAVAWRADQERSAVPRIVEPEAQSDAAETTESRRTGMQVPTGPLVDAVTLWYPKGFSVNSISRVLGDWMRGDSLDERPEITVAVELPGAGEASQHERIRELALRVIGIWANLSDPAGKDEAAQTRIAIACPWNAAELRKGGVTPAPEWPVFANLATQLAGRRIVGTYPTDLGTTCLILAQVDPRSGEMSRGALIAWRNADSAYVAGRGSAGAAGNTGSTAMASGLDVASLGDRIRLVDVFGNQSPISAEGLVLSDIPTFIEGVDPYVATFVAGMRLEPRFVESVVAEHESEVLLTNPWPIRITGSIQIRETDLDRSRMFRSNAWNITPAGIVDFAIGPGDTFRLPLSFTFGPSQLAGYKKLTILSRVTADREYPLLKLDTTMEVGLADYQLDLEAQRLPTTGGPDVVVIATVTNTSARTRSLRLEAATARLPTQQLQVSDLGPGQTIIKRFVFKGAGPAMRGRNVIVSLSDLEEAKRLNKAVVSP